MINFKHLFDLARKAVTAWIDDYAPSMGAAISYYTIFSLAPLLVIVIAVAGAIFGREAAQGEIVTQISGLVGRDGAEAVQAMLAAANEPDKGLIAGLISVVVLLVGATSVFAELQSALDRIWHVPEREKPSGVWGVLRARVLSFGLILGLAFLLVVSLLVSAGVAAFGTWFGGLMPGWELMLQVLNALISVGILTLLFALIYKLMPTARIAWHDVWIGALVTSVLFVIGKTAIGLYLGKSGVNESFAAAGSLVVLVAWVYYAAQVFLLGAEFTKVFASEHGSVAGVKAVAATEAHAAAAEAGTDRVAVTGAPVIANASAIASPSPSPSAASSGEPVRRDAADWSPEQLQQKQLQLARQTEAATRSLVQQALVLGAVSLGSLFMKGLQKKQRRRLKQRPRFR